MFDWVNRKRKIAKHKKFLWYTDTHFNYAFPFSTYRFVKHINKEKPEGVFITGDISHGKWVESHLNRIAKKVDCDVYFVLGNHDYHGRTMASVHDDMRRVCSKHQNLHWMTETGIVRLDERTGLIGTEGWYDMRLGDPRWIRYTLDWLTIVDVRFMKNMVERLARFTLWATRSAAHVKKNLRAALQDYDTVYVLTHFPPWKEATRDEGTRLENFWLPYNTNLIMGEAIEEVMLDFPDKHVIVLTGHTHTDCWITVADNIECRVNTARYVGSLRNEERIYI